MIWFKHMCDASNGETISQIEEEFGLEGYARWFKLMEVIASKSDGENFYAEYSLKKWCLFLKAKPKKLVMFLECLGNLQAINMKETGNVIRIELPNLFKFKQKDLGRSRPSRIKPASNPPLEKEKEIDTEEELEKKRVAAAKALLTKSFNLEFDKIWPFLEAYPHNKNYETAKKQYAACRRAGFSEEEIQEYYKTEHIDKADAPKFVTQFKKAVTIGNLEAWKKIPKLVPVKAPSVWDIAIEKAKEIDAARALQKLNGNN